MAANPDEGLEKSAILLLSLGEDEAAEVLKSLGPKEVQKLGHAMAAIKSVPRERVEAVLDDFHEYAGTGGPVAVDENLIKAMLTKALGDDRAANLISRIMHGGDTAGIEGLKWMDAPTVADLIRNEHPQIIATILVHLERDRAAGVLALLTDRLRNDVMLRIATFGGVQPAALSELTEVLNSVLAGQGAKRSKMGGVRTAAEILNMMSSADEEAVVESLRERDNDLAQKIIDEMFVFDNLLDVEDRAIQLILKEIDNDTLMVALKGAQEELRAKFLRNMSSRAAEMLREDLEAQGPIRMSKVETEQKKILQIARRLAESGQIVLGNSGDDAYV